jgi:hypothetical protein
MAAAFKLRLNAHQAKKAKGVKSPSLFVIVGVQRIASLRFLAIR